MSTSKCPLLLLPIAPIKLMAFIFHIIILLLTLPEFWIKSSWWTNECERNLDCMCTGDSHGDHKGIIKVRRRQCFPFSSVWFSKKLASRLWVLDILSSQYTNGHHYARIHWRFRNTQPTTQCGTLSLCVPPLFHCRLISPPEVTTILNFMSFPWLSKTSVLQHIDA